MPCSRLRCGWPHTGAVAVCASSWLLLDVCCVEDAIILFSCNFPQQFQPKISEGERLMRPTLND